MKIAKKIGLFLLIVIIAFTLVADIATSFIYIDMVGAGTNDLATSITLVLIIIINGFSAICKTLIMTALLAFMNRTLAKYYEEGTD